MGVYNNIITIDEIKRDLAFDDKCCFNVMRIAIVTGYVIATIAMITLASRGIRSPYPGVRLLGAIAVPTSMVIVISGIKHADYLYSRKIIDYSQKEVAEEVLLDLASNPNLITVAKKYDPLELRRYNFVTGEGCHVLKNIHTYFDKADTKDKVEAKTEELQKQYFRAPPQE